MRTRRRGATRARATLEDVARRAQVSIATVSRCLNAPATVREQTRERVETAIAETGYTPHFGGRALALDRTNTVGVVIPTMANAIFAEGLQALQETLSDAGVTMLVATSHYDEAKEAQQVQTLLARGVDAIALIGEARPQETYELIRRRRVPFVTMWIYAPNADHPSVGFDNFAAAHAIAGRVLSYGHRSIAMIAGRTAGNDRARARILGVRAALAEVELPLQPPYLVEARYDLEESAERAAVLLAMEAPPTAIICGNDVIAAGTLNCARRLGVAVPADVSVVGFDNIDLAKVVEPRLTTVHVPHRRMGRAAAGRLLELMAGEANVTSIAIETAIVERDSLGPAK